MVRPSDVCDLVVKPDVNDAIITSLAKECPISGSDNYKIVSRSLISDKKLNFANLAIQWLEELDLNIFQLSPLPRDDHMLSYSNTTKSKLVANQFSPKVVENFDNLNEFYKFFVDMPENNITIEIVTQYLLTQTDTSQYKMVMEYLTQNAELLNPFVLNDFVAVLLRDLMSSSSVEKVEMFDAFLNECLLNVYPQLLEEVPPVTLDQLAYITASLSNLQTANKALTLLCQNYRLAAAPATFNLYMTRYNKLAALQNFTREQILLDLSNLKPVLFHYKLSLVSTKLILHQVVDSPYELSHLVKFMRETPALLAQFGEELEKKLEEVQEKSGDSELVRKVQLANLRREIKSHE